MRKQNNNLIGITPEEWAGLDAVARSVKARNRTGLHAKQMTAAELVRQIARGELLVTPAKPYQMPPGLDEAIAANEKAAKKTPAPMQQLDMFR